MGSAVSACPDDAQARVYDDLKTAFEKEKNGKYGNEIETGFPNDFSSCLELAPPDRDKYDAVVYSRMEKIYQESLNRYIAPVLTTPLKKLPDYIDECIYVHDRWPLLVDTSGQGIRFLKYQRGSFLLAESPVDVQPENLRRALVGALQHGTMLVLSFDEAETIDMEKLFDKDTFPREILNKSELFKPETIDRILRPDKGDPEPNQFLPKDDFKFIVVTKNTENSKKTACENNLCILNCLDPSVKQEEQQETIANYDVGGAAIAEAFGVKDVNRNSQKLLEAAFEGQWDEMKDLIEKGYSFESEDAHKHTPLSEAACQGHNDIIQKLLDMGANPNAQNDQGRTALYRASYNGHLETIKLLLNHGADPRLSAAMETPYDVAKTDECRKLLENWDIEMTERLLGERQAEMERKLEERLKTAAEREAYARDKIRKELIQITLEGTAEELQERLQELADEAIKNNERPRGTAEVRDENGHTLLLLAVWKNKVDTVKMLLTHWQTLDEEFDKIERRVFWTNIRARQSKGWNSCALATFHGYKTLLELLLKHGCDPYVKNSYAKNSFDFAQDELDAARAVVTDRSEIRSVLEEWERSQHPAAAKQREKELKDAEESNSKPSASKKNATGKKGISSNKSVGKKGKKKGKRASK